MSRSLSLTGGGDTHLFSCPVSRKEFCKKDSSPKKENWQTEQKHQKSSYFHVTPGRKISYQIIRLKNQLRYSTFF